MEAACSLERVSFSLGFGSISHHKQACKIGNSISNCLHCRNGYWSPPSVYLSSPNSKLSYPSSSPQRSSLTSFVHHFLCSFEMGSSDHLSRNLVAAPSTSSYSPATAETLYAPFIHISIIIKFPLVGCKYITSGPRMGIRNFSSLLKWTICSHGERKNLANFDKRNASPSRAMMVMTVLALPLPLEYKRRSYKTTSLAHGLRESNRLAAEQCPPHSRVFWLRRGGKNRAHDGQLQFFEAIGQNGTGLPVPEDENPKPTSEQGPQDSRLVSPGESDPPEVDWRAFRARLVVTEHTAASDETGISTKGNTGRLSPNSLGTRWAHPILAPEAGCLLIATDKIDGQQSFERSVVLLLSPGSSNPHEGPYGLIINKPLSCCIKDITPKDRTLVKYFGNCQVYRGGPLDEDMFLLLHGTSGVKGCREVIPGVYYGGAGGVAEIMKDNHQLDYRFFFGYSGWGVEQLEKEIDGGLWCVAACSTDLITGHSAAGLWEEILLLMGGKYGELSKRPRRRHF